MIGHWNKNHDTKQIAYDLKVPLRGLVGKFILTRQHLEQALKIMDEKNLDSIETTTSAVDGFTVRNLKFDGLAEIISKVKILLEDLTELQGKIEKDEDAIRLKDETAKEEVAKTPKKV